jgi:SagB-type dehydrogenase family enzyme
LRGAGAYGPGPLVLGELSALLWAAAGITARERGLSLRTAPSAGGLYPIEHYVVVNDVEDLERGLYHYDVLGRSLERLAAGDLRAALTRAAFEQRICADAQAVVSMSTVGRPLAV